MHAESLESKKFINRNWSCQGGLLIIQEAKLKKFLQAHLKRAIAKETIDPRQGGVGTWSNFCWVCATGILEPLIPHLL